MASFLFKVQVRSLKSNCCKVKLLSFALCYFAAGAKQAIVKAWGWGWGWPTRGGSCQKGYLFQASGTWKGRDFAHFGLYKGPNRQTNAFYGCDKLKVKKSQNQVVLNVLILSLIPSLQSVHLHQGYHLSKEGIRKQYLFCQKWYNYKRVRGWTSEQSLPI